MQEHKLIDIQRRLKQPIDKAVGLPNERYVTDASFIEDRSRVTGANWACIAFAEDLPEQNTALPIDYMGIPLVITRDQEDVLRVFHNVCSHRGMHLVEKPCKTKGLLVCPYHSWSYKLSGELRGTPHIGGYGTHQHPDFDRDAASLREVRSVIWLNAVFINLSGDAIAFEDYIAPLTAQFDELCTAEDRLRFGSNHIDCRTKMTVQSNWKLPVENYLESYHLPTVHPELNRISPLDEHFDLTRFDYGGGQGSQNYAKTIIDNKELPSLSSWPKDKENLAVYPVLYPNTLIGLHSDHLFIMFLQPTGKDETVEHVRISYVDQAPTQEEYRPHRAALLESWTNVFSEDIFAVERMQKGRSSPGYAGGMFSPAMDEPTLHFHQWVADQLVGNVSK